MLPSSLVVRANVLAGLVELVSRIGVLLVKGCNATTPPVAPSATPLV